MKFILHGALHCSHIFIVLFNTVGLYSICYLFILNNVQGRVLVYNRGDTIQLRFENTLLMITPPITYIRYMDIKHLMMTAHSLTRLLGTMVRMVFFLGKTRWNVFPIGAKTKVVAILITWLLTFFITKMWADPATDYDSFDIMSPDGIGII